MIQLLFLLACEDIPEQQTSYVEIPAEAYDWSCRDRQDYSEIEIQAGVCNEFESMTVSVILINNRYVEKEMYHEGGCWWYSLISQEENCIEIQEIIVTAQEGGSNGR